jgi:hypothetical protein
LRIRERSFHRLGEKTVNRAGKEPARGGSENDKDERTDQAATQLVEMFQKGHLAEFFFARSVCR